jgi:hypothetical protein
MGTRIFSFVFNKFLPLLCMCSMCVRYNGRTSSTILLQCGVPQGSVLGPVIFILYYADVIRIASKHGFKAHSYADDLQLYDHAVANNCATLVPRMSACISEINDWMASNRLKLNPTKTEIIWLGSARKLKYCSLDELSIAGVMLKPSTQVRDLGVQVDSNLSMSAHINHLTRTCFYHIRQLRTVRKSLTVDTTHALVRALVHSRLDYCNSVLAGQPKYCFDKLQSVLRASARLVLRLPGWSNVSELIRRQLHWLPFPERVQFKLCTLVYKCLHQQAPVYLTEMCVPVSTHPGRSHLRSAAIGDLLVPPTRTKTIGPHGFFCSGPSAWNKMSTDLKDSTLSLNSFKKKLKTFLFV